MACALMPASIGCGVATGQETNQLRVAVFQADATPPLGSPVAYAPVIKIEDPLSARGIVLLGAGEPIVLCAVDWIGIANGGHDEWRRRLSMAAGTTPDRVAVHALHQHDGVRCDFTAEDLLAAQGLGGLRFDLPFVRQTIVGVSKAIREAIQVARPVTHLGVGKAKVEKVASNRRILGPDGKVAIARSSSYRIPEPILSRLAENARRDGYELSASRVDEALAAPEGVIDPWLKMLTFYHHDDPIVVLTQRMADGMRRAFEATQRRPISAQDIAWRVEPVKLPTNPKLDFDKLQATLLDPKATESDRLSAASKVAFLGRMRAGLPIELSCLRLADVDILHMPAELFVEYQLAAQAMKPDATVCMAAYGDYGPGYIGTEISYWEGGYETQPSASNVSPEVESVLMDGIRRLLN
jgi:hypothetical protein